MKRLTISILFLSVLACAVPTQAASPRAATSDISLIEAAIGADVANPRMSQRIRMRSARAQQAACFCKRFESVCEKLIAGSGKCLKWVRKCQEYDKDC